MALAEKSMTLDISKPGCRAPLQKVTLRQGDKGSQQVSAVLVSGTDPVNLTGLSVALVATLADGSYAEQACTVDDAQGGEASVVLDPRWTGARGYARVAYFELRKGSDVVASSETFALEVLPAADESAGDAKEFSSFVDQMKSDYEAGISQAEQSFDASIAQMKAESQEELQQVSSQWDATMSGLQDEAEQLIGDLGQVAEDHGMPLYVYDSVDEAPTDAKCAYFVYDEVRGCWALYYEDGKPEGGDA